MHFSAEYIFFTEYNGMPFIAYVILHPVLDVKVTKVSLTTLVEDFYFPHDIKTCFSVIVNI